MRGLIVCDNTKINSDAPFIAGHLFHDTGGHVNLAPQGYSNGHDMTIMHLAQDTCGLASYYSLCNMRNMSSRAGSTRWHEDDMNTMHGDIVHGDIEGLFLEPYDTIIRNERFGVK